MRSTILTNGDIGTIVHDIVLNVGDTQEMVFQDDDPPPIFDPDVPKYDNVRYGESVHESWIRQRLKN